MPPSPSPDLEWSAEFLPSVGLLLAATGLFLGFHFGADARKLRLWLRQRGIREPAAQAGGVLLRRLSGGLFLGLGSILTLALLEVPVSQWGIQEPVWSVTGYWLAGMSLGVAGLLFFNSKQPAFLRQYPEIRASRVTRAGAWCSAGAWAFYLLGYEFMFRGLLLFPLVEIWGSWPAVTVGACLYALAHLHKAPSECLASLPMGILLAAMSLSCGTWWPAFAVHVFMAVLSERLAAWRHPRIRWGT